MSASELQTSHDEKRCRHAAEKVQLGPELANREQNKIKPPKVKEGTDRRWYDA